MARKPPPGHCVHCLKYSENLTWDHVFPVSWYPESNVSTAEKWKVPSCRHCNGRLGKIEREMLIKLGLCIDVEDHNAKGIAEKALRALDPREAKKPKDALARKRTLDRIVAEMEVIDPSNKIDVYPGFGAERFPNEPLLTALTIDWGSTAALGEKIVRGLIYLGDNGRMIDNNYEIHMRAVEESVAIGALQKIERWFEYAHEPGIVVHRAIHPVDDVTSIFRIEIWKQLRIYGLVMPVGALKES